MERQVEWTCGSPAFSGQGDQVDAEWTFLLCGSGKQGCSLKAGSQFRGSGARSTCVPVSGVHQVPKMTAGALRFGSCWLSLLPALLSGFICSQIILAFFTEV